MAKGKTSVFYCQSCGNESSKWMGQCPVCKEWNTFVEEIVEKKPAGVAKGRVDLKMTEPVPLSAIHATDELRLSTGMAELDRVLGGGIVEGSLILVGGDPGIGKSTLLLQVCRNLVQGTSVGAVGSQQGSVSARAAGSQQGSVSAGAAGNQQGSVSAGAAGSQQGSASAGAAGRQPDSMTGANGVSVLYVSGEESLQQIKLRAQRIGDFSDQLTLLCETNLDTIQEVIKRRKPQVVVIDSIQTMYNEAVGSAPGSVSQVRESTGVLMQLAKGMGISIFVIGHVTKEGVVAGPRVLEHMVDTVLYFEGDRHESYRILRGVKNRFGSTNEIGVFEMREEGLVEVANPSEYMLSGKPIGASGSVVACSMEGTRPILVEVQALVCRSNFGNPRRTAIGTDYNRVNLLMAVLEKRLGVKLAECDAYVNIAGGIRMNEPALDMGIALAILSSQFNCPIDEKTICFGEIGLSGEVRGVSMARQRVLEAQKLGFETCIMPKAGSQKLGDITGIRLVGVSNVREALGAISK